MYICKALNAYKLTQNKKKIYMYLNAAISVYLASRETAKKEALSRLVTITIKAARAAPNAANRSTNPPILFVNFTIFVDQSELRFLIFFMEHKKICTHEEKTQKHMSS